MAFPITNKPGRNLRQEASAQLYTTLPYLLAIMKLLKSRLSLSAKWHVTTTTTKYAWEIPMTSS